MHEEPIKFTMLELWYNIGEMNDRKTVLVVEMGTSPVVMAETKKEKRNEVRYDA